MCFCWCLCGFSGLARRIEGPRRRAALCVSELLLLAAAAQETEAEIFLRAAAPEAPLVAEDIGVRALLSFWPNTTWYAHSRFTFDDLRCLAHFFFPATLLLPFHRGRVSALDALVVLLLRFASRMTLYAQERITGYEDYMLSAITHTAAHHPVDH